MTNWEKYFSTPERAAMTLSDLAHNQQEASKDAIEKGDPWIPLIPAFNYIADSFDSPILDDCHYLLGWLESEPDA